MAGDSPIITGFYRYTDIWFEWSSALPNPDDVRPLKASLAHDSLVHLQHPLHVDGVDGVQLYLGTFPTGESRLLFSSAQVDYIRYWLHAMGLTKETIPLPYSDCLLTGSDLRHVSTVVYKDGFSLRNAVKKIEKNNKRLKGANPTLTFRRELFERVRNLWREQKGVWCALDFEGWELDHTVITEFGWRLIGWKDSQRVEKLGHLIVDEHQKYRNTKYVPDHRYNYEFGQSEVVKKSAFKAMVCKCLDELTTYSGPVFLVFHDNNQDIKYLKSPSIGASLEGMSFVLPANTPDTGLFVVDTSDLFAALEGMESTNRRALGRVCNLMQISTKNLHNAGNDAYYTLEVMTTMAAGDPVDIQREQRWPNKTAAGVKVEFEENSDRCDTDYSDY